MTALTKSLTTPFRLPVLHWPRFNNSERKRRQTTIDLIHSSPHLLRDIGATEGRMVQRGR
ncbi:hypothetical protein [Devosia sp. 2618]|uniref:hypothetical protein n=1 Tax=Devosia sp. 2618 TaxID=3156454 RepID=UPI0033957809